MIKGVQRQIIEVTHTGSPYFERAFLVVRGDGAAPAADTLQTMAHKVVEQAATYSGLRRERWLRGLWRGLFGVGCAGMGAAVMWVVEKLG